VLPTQPAKESDTSAMRPVQVSFTAFHPCVPVGFDCETSQPRWQRLVAKFSLFLVKSESVVRKVRVLLPKCYWPRGRFRDMDQFWKGTATPIEKGALARRLYHKNFSFTALGIYQN
jgi:hypothetical protein